MKYHDLSVQHRFEPVIFETSGVPGRTTSALISEIGRRISFVTFDARETRWLWELLTMVVRGNAASVLAAGRA